MVGSDGRHPEFCGKLPHNAKGELCRVRPASSRLTVFIVNQVKQSSVQTDGGWADPNNPYIIGNESGIAKSCHTNCSNGNEIYSFHSGGANHVFADGSVKFIRANMDIRQFVKLFTRAGGDIAVID